MEPKRFAAAGEITAVKRHDMFDDGAFLQMDATVAPESVFLQANWYRSNAHGGSLARHRSDELMMFIGSDCDNKKDLGAEIIFRIENDVINLKSTCMVYIPGGKAHGISEIKNLSRPVLCISYHYSGPVYEDSPAEASEPEGSYSDFYATEYAPPEDRRTPPEVLARMRQLVYVDGRVIPGAPYIESLWFALAGQDGPPSHIHGFDEIIGFIGGDPAQPEELNGYVEYDVGEYTVKSDKSVFIFVPTGVPHSPIRMPKVERPILHFSGGGKGGYDRDFSPGEDG